jgi:hypothetical protein
MRTKSLLLLSFLSILLSFPTLASGSETSKGKGGWASKSVDITAPPPDPNQLSNLKSGGKVGLGVLIGSRTGITLKLWPKRRHGISFDVGSTNFSNTISFALSYQFHAKLLRASGAPVSAQFYFGVGGRARVLIHSVPDDPSDPDSEFTINTAAVIGVRVPIGFSFLIEGFPVELFIEAAPAVDFWQALGFDFEGVGGARVYF